MVERELGRILADISNLKEEQEKIRTKVHTLSGHIQPALLLTSTVTVALQRIEKLESWKNKWALIIGVIMGVSLVMGYLIRSFTHGL